MKLEINNEADLAAIAAWEQPTTAGAHKTLPLPHLITAAELFAGDLPVLEQLLENLLWQGLTMLIARPKAGKSWLTLQCAIQVAGGPAVTGVTVRKTGEVLYAALEEPKSRTMSRVRRLATEGPWTKRLHFFYDLLPLMGGGAEQLEELLKQLRPRLVVLDTLTALVKTGAKGSSDVFRSQYAELERIRKLAEHAGTAVIVVHHTRKGVADSAIEAVAGTGGIAAAVDSLWLLKKKANGEATLEIVGRETEERTFMLQFGVDPFGWQILGDQDEQILTSERIEVMDLLREDGPLTPARIATELGKQRGAVRMLLKRMKDDGQLLKNRRNYLLPPQTLSVTE